LGRSRVIQRMGPPWGRQIVAPDAEVVHLYQ